MIMLTNVTSGAKQVKELKVRGISLVHMCASVLFDVHSVCVSTNVALCVSA